MCLHLCTYSHRHSILHTGGEAFSQKIERSLSIFSDNFVVYSCSCNVLPAETPGRILQCVKWLKWGWLAYTTPSVRDICTFVVLCSVIRPFLSLNFILCNKEEFRKELSRKIVLCQIYIGHRSASFPLLSACHLVEFDSSVICHVFMYC